MESQRKNNQRQSIGANNKSILSSSFVRKSLDRQQIVAMTSRQEDYFQKSHLSNEIGSLSVFKVSPQKIIASERMVLAQSNQCSFAVTPSKDCNKVNEDESVLKLESNNDEEQVAATVVDGKKNVMYTAEELQSAVYNSQQADIKPIELSKPNSRMKKTIMGGQQQLKFAVFSGNYPQYIRDCLSDRDGKGVQWVELEATVDSINMCDFIWKPFNFAKFGFDLFDRRGVEIPKRPVVYNHFENIHILSTKTGLLQTLKDYYHNQCKEAIEAKYKVQDTLPMAYIVTSIPGDHEFNEFKKKFKQIDRGYYLNEKMAPKHMQQNFWLLKPSNLNQGKGIEIFNSLKQVSQYLQCKSTDLQWVVQKYIERPLLYNKRKFDIRVMALATNEMELFFYDIGYMRTSSDEYSLNNQNKFVHLTNNCYQKNSNNYERFEEGNQLSFQQFQNYLDMTFPELKVSFNEHMLPRIKDLVIDCFVSAVGGLNPGKREHCFELMGFDFLIDEDFRVWLIEVNTNPYFGVVNAQLPNFIANLVDDTFKLTLDKTFPPGYEKPFRTENLYELLYSQSKGVNKRRSFTESMYPVTAIKEQLDRERENMLALRFPGAKGAVPSEGGLHRNGNNGQLPTIVRSAGPPLHNQIKIGQNNQQSTASNNIITQGMVVVGGCSGTPQTTNGQNKTFCTTNDGENSSAQNFQKPFQQQRTVISRGDKSSLIVQQPTKDGIPLTGQSTRSKVSLSICKDIQYAPDDQLQPKKRSQFSKYKNNLQSEERMKPGQMNSLHKRRNNIGRIEPLQNNNSTSLGRIYNRDQALTMMSQGSNTMAQRRGTTPGINLKDQAIDKPIPENEATNALELSESQILDEGQPIPNQSPRRSTMSKLQNMQGNINGTNLSILLRKKTDEKIQATQQSQNEYLNKIQRMLKVKTLLEQVKESLIQIDSYEQKRKDFSKIFSQICHVFSNPEGTAKKEVTQAIQAFRMMIFSQFIIHFNDKSVLSKLLDILKQPQSHLQNQSYLLNLEIRECVLKNLTEISKHYSIRTSLLSRKLLSKLMKAMYEHVQHHMTVTLKRNASLANSMIKKSATSQILEGDESKENDQREESKHSLERIGNEVAKSQMEVRVVQNYVSLVVCLGSVNNTKFYIPGETKEVEALRKKSIMHGLLAFVQAIIQLIIGEGAQISEGITDSMKRLQFELLETVDAPHFRLHLYTIYGILKHRMTNLKITEENPQIEQDKEALSKILNDIANEKLFSQLRMTLEHQIGNSQKTLKIKVPAFIDQLDHFLTGSYLISTFNRYKKIIEYTISHPQVANYHNDQSPPPKKKIIKNHLQPSSASNEGGKETKTNELLESQIELLQQNLNQQYKKKFVRPSESKVIKAKTSAEIIYDNKKIMHGTIIGNTGMPGLELGGGRTTQISYYQSIERDLIGAESKNLQLNQTPEIKGGADIINGATPAKPDEQQLTDFVKTNLPLAQSTQARNLVLGSSTFVKSNTNAIEKNISLGIGRTISSENQQQSPLILPSLEASKKQQTREISNPLYFMKLQPYLQSNKITTRLSVPKRSSNQNHHNHHMALLTQAYGQNLGGPSSIGPPNPLSLQFNSVKKLESQINHTSSQGQIGQLNQHVIGNMTMKSQYVADSQALGSQSHHNQYSQKAYKNKQSSLLKGQKNNGITASNTNSSSKMIVKDVIDSLKSEQTRSLDCVKDDPYSQQAYLKVTHQSNESLSKGGYQQSDKKNTLVPLGQNLGATPKHLGVQYKMMSITESIANAIQITENNN